MATWPKDLTDEKASAMSCTVLPFDVKSVFRARCFVEQFVAEQAPGGSADALLVIASELVTNAIVHGAEPVELRLHHHDGAVTIEVADGDPCIDNVRLRALDQRTCTGRGLRVVATLADRWGTQPTQSGKTVWATTLTTRLYPD